MTRGVPPVVAVSAVLLALCTVSPLMAVLVFEKGTTTPVRGYLVSQDETRVVVDQLLPDGSTRRRQFRRDELDDVVIAVSAERLKTLHPDRPRDYREYADDLSEKRADPDARRLAMRLYLIAAYLEPAELGRGCLLAMADLAPSADQQRSYRAMAYLLDPNHDRAVLKTPTLAVADLTDAQQALLVRGLRALRYGRKAEANALARQRGFKELLVRCGDLFTPDQYLAAAEALDGTLPPELLRRVLRIELALLSGGGDPAAEAATKAWTAARLGGAGTVAELTLEGIAPFDPRQCLYRDGRWVTANDQ